MTDSRVEAVARAIAVRYQHPPDKGWEDFQEDAQAAIDANDAWMKAEEKRTTTPCPRCGARCGVGDFECRGCGEAITWEPGK